MSQSSSRDQELEVPGGELMSQDDMPDANAGGDNSLLTALGGGGGDDDFMDEELSLKSASKLTPRAAIIAGIIVVGGGMIFGMRQYEIKQGMIMDVVGSFPDFSVNANDTALSAEQQVVLDNLRASVNATFSPPDLPTNPMELEGVEETQVAEVDVPKGPDIEGLTEQYIRLFEGIVVTSIVPSGRVKVAVINKKPVVIGNVVADYFVVREIATDAETRNMYVKVELAGFDPAVDGAVLILHMRTGGK